MAYRNQKKIEKAIKKLSKKLAIEDIDIIDRTKKIEEQTHNLFWRIMRDESMKSQELDYTKVLQAVLLKHDPDEIKRQEKTRTDLELKEKIERAIIENKIIENKKRNTAIMGLEVPGGADD